MMNHRFLFASLLPLALLACGGAPSTNLGGGAPASDGGAPGSDGGAPASDGAAPAADAGSGSTIGTHCDTETTTTAALCIENAEGHAGDIVDVPIYFLATAACSDAYEANGHLVADANDFDLANPVQQVACVSRDYYAAPAPGTIEIIWNAFGGGSVGGCPNDIAPGKLDTVKLEILPGTPPGDYPITWNDASVAGKTAVCSFLGGSNGIAGTIRVLP